MLSAGWLYGLDRQTLVGMGGQLICTHNPNPKSS